MLKYHIQTIELSSNQTTIQFNSIPQDFTDLMAVCSTRTSGSGIVGAIIIRPNGSNGYIRRLVGAGTGTPYSDQVDPISGLTSTNGNTANTFGNASFYITDYASSRAKSISVDSVQERNATESYIQLAAGIFGAVPITSITFDVGGTDSLMAGSTISLYGVRRGSDGIVNNEPAVGGTVTTSGGYTIHTFTTSGTLTVRRPLEVEYLVIAGGAGGGNTSTNNTNGGGGAGGYRSSVVGESSGGGASAESKLNLTAGTNYAITVGAGGAAASTGRGSAGSDSVFSTITSIGGGGGGANTGANTGGSGGSGGGGCAAAGGTGTAGQGTNGGTSGGWGGGGGGASTAGTGGTNSSNPGAGGSGLASSITGTSVARAGGGGPGNSSASGVGGGAGGFGGGGDGASALFGTGAGSGVANTGSGGGGGVRSSLPAGAGGSGVVIIRYLTPA